MSFQKPPGGTRGARVPPSNAVTRALNRVAMSWHRRSGDRFQGQDLLYLTTVGAKTGQKRQTTVARFPDGEDAWLVVASAGGSAHHPAWYHNIAAHPDQVWVEFGGRQLRVTPTQLDGDARAQAWKRITQLQPRYAGYERKTDRAIPVIRLSPPAESANPATEMTSHASSATAARLDPGRPKTCADPRVAPVESSKTVLYQASARHTPQAGRRPN
jgi:deazaflavin-dependent oxidoreductase (nitroreductase family)